MTDMDVLVLTDDELACIAATNRTPWALPLGYEDDEASVISALAGERSLFARGLIGRRDGRYALGTVAFDYVRPGLQAEPEMVLFVIDDQHRWVLQGMSLAWYRGDDQDVLEVRAANGLHHFTKPVRANLVAALRNYVSSAHESGFGDLPPEVEFSLCAVTVNHEDAYLIREGTVLEGSGQGAPLASREWRTSSVDRVLSLIA